jgi:hypothetical protein
MANFQLSPEKTASKICWNRTVAGVEGARLLDTSYMANVSEMANLITSVRKTAVDVK